MIVMFHNRVAQTSQVEPSGFPIATFGSDSVPRWAMPLTPTPTHPESQFPQPTLWNLRKSVQSVDKTSVLEHFDPEGIGPQISQIGTD